MKKKGPMESKQFSQAVGRALRRAARVARKTARMHGTPIYVWENGKVVGRNRDSADSMFVNGYFTTPGHPTPQSWA